VCHRRAVVGAGKLVGDRVWTAIAAFQSATVAQTKAQEFTTAAAGPHVYRFRMPRYSFDSVPP
jgi:hypothetical protein